MVDRFESLDDGIKSFEDMIESHKHAIFDNEIAEMQGVIEGAIRRDEQILNWLKELKELKEDDAPTSSQDEKDILKCCIEMLHELVEDFEDWYRYVHGDDAIECLDDEEMFCIRKPYMSIVRKLFLWHTNHSGGTSTCKKCRELGVDWSREIEFGFEKEEEDDDA